MACDINLGSSVVITGGYYSPTRVSEYGEAGFIRSLPDLNQERWGHGCSYYDNEEGTKVKLDTEFSTLIGRGLTSLGSHWS